ncbi:iron-sulfur cluster assembly accessory protein [Aquabacterium sp.]|uniref:HesB/IscA family protein n=1 Tax=Aquabacterium sp. TaxID=1872578 RepID=UPI0025BF1CE3|nr:iron-sulfur cluster assembly accessory protein [Aquabacterium sp.]
MLPNWTVTPAAEKFIRRMVKFSGLPASAGFRLTVTPGGCSGFNSEFTVEAQPAAGDEVADVNGIRVFLPAESRLILNGVIVDFADTPTKSGLTFFNPSAAPCACSSSGDSASTAPAMTKIEIGSIKVSSAPRTSA